MIGISGRQPAREKNEEEEEHNFCRDAATYPFSKKL
jgi:hypothetical protein